MRKSMFIYTQTVLLWLGISSFSVLAELVESRGDAAHPNIFREV